MSALTTVEKMAFEDLFGMASGYVLHPHLSNHSYRSLILESSGMDITSDRYAVHGDSKAKRLRAFWDCESDEIVVNVLCELLGLWELKNPDASPNDRAKAQRCRDIIDKLNGGPRSRPETTETEFLDKKFKELEIHRIPLEGALIPILEARFEEAERTLQADSPLATIFLCGSILEGLLLGIALASPKEFNQAAGSPKDSTNCKVKGFQDWKLAEMIEVACELGYLGLDVKKFSHALRDFRNYIHPYHQLSSRFTPDKHTAQICLQVLRAAIASLARGRKL